LAPAVESARFGKWTDRGLIPIAQNHSGDCGSSGLYVLGWVSLALWAMWVSDMGGQRVPSPDGSGYPSFAANFFDLAENWLLASLNSQTSCHMTGRHLC
jgi:hypothetical protein